MDDASRRGLLGKGWDSLTHKGPAGLGRDVRDYVRWRLSTREVRTAQHSALGTQHPLSNLELNQQELQHLPEVLQSRPILVYAEATTRCNLHCFMCRLSFPETTRQVRDHMSLEVFARLEPLLEPGSRLSLFGLGEPLLNPSFVEMLRIAKQQGAFVGLNSNAMLLTERIARAMVELEQDLLVISFSGGTRETYERVITGASYDRALSHLRRLNEIKRESGIRGQGSGDGGRGDAETRGRGDGERRREDSEPSTQHSALSTGLERVKPVLQLQFTAMRDNVRELPEFVRLALELRCAGAVVMPLTVVDPSLSGQSILQPELRPVVERTFQEARAVAAAAPYPFELSLPTLGLSTQDSGLSDQRSAPSTRHSALCHEPWQTFYARDDGTVNTCCYSNRVLGDLKEQSALEIWNGELYGKFRARMRSADKPAECRVCHKLLGDDLYDQRIDQETFYDEL